MNTSVPFLVVPLNDAEELSRALKMVDFEPNDQYNVRRLQEAVRAVLSNGSVHEPAALLASLFSSVAHPPTQHTEHLVQPAPLLSEEMADASGASLAMQVAALALACENDDMLCAGKSQSETEDGVTSSSLTWAPEVTEGAPTMPPFFASWDASDSSPTAEPKIYNGMSSWSSDASYREEKLGWDSAMSSSDSEEADCSPGCDSSACGSPMARCSVAMVQANIPEAVDHGFKEVTGRTQRSKSSSFSESSVRPGATARTQSVQLTNMDAAAELSAALRFQVSKPIFPVAERRLNDLRDPGVDDLARKIKQDSKAAGSHVQWVLVLLSAASIGPMVASSATKRTPKYLMKEMSRAKDVYHQVQNTLVKALLPNAYELAKNLSLDFYKACLTYAKDKYADGYPAVLAAFASAVQAVQKKGKSACEAALGFDPKAATPAQLEAALLERMRREFHYVA